MTAAIFLREGPVHLDGAFLLFTGVVVSFNPFGLGGAITVFTRRFLGL